MFYTYVLIQQLAQTNLLIHFEKNRKLDAKIVTKIIKKSFKIDPWNAQGWNNVPDGTPMIAIEKAAHHILLDQPLELAAAIKNIAKKWV